MMKQLEETIDINGVKLTIQTGKLAHYADVSVYARLGDTCVLVTLVVGQSRSDIDYLPLSVDYQEKLYAGGIIKGSRWVKREGRPSDVAVLVSRLIDRGIRPLIPKTIRNDIQIIATLLSYDEAHSPDIVATLGASAAVAFSKLPWYGPIGTTRIGYDTTDGKNVHVINPSDEQQKTLALDLVVTSTADKVVMIETGANIVDESVILAGIEMAMGVNKKFIESIEEISKKLGVVKIEAPVDEKNDEIVKDIEAKYLSDIEKLARQRSRANGEHDDDYIAKIDEIIKSYDGTYDAKQVMGALNKVIESMVKRIVISTGKRVDGREMNEVRPILVEAGLLPRTHGSALFQRGETQVLSITTLGALSLEQIIEGPEGMEAKRYMHHYSDGPYSYGQTGRMFGPSRRAIGHGALAEKAIEPVLPKSDDFPYAIRVVSEVLAENGSSSMGSICGSSLSLMNAGVPISAAVAGMAMGIITESDDKYYIMSDIVGLEDFGGEMDFKIAGTADGITAIQLDVKNKGLTMKMIGEIFAQSKEGRLFILRKMNAVLGSANKDISKYAPKVEILIPPEDKIGEIIGPGGKNIRAITAETGAEINITDDGRVSISGISQESVDAAKLLVENVYRVMQINEEFTGKVIKILPFGAVVEILPGKEGLLHISRLGQGFVKEVTDVVNDGDTVVVKVAEVDPRGKLSLALVKKL